MKPKNYGRLIRASLLTILLLALLVQVFLLVRSHGQRTIEIYKAIGQTGTWRGANFAFSQDVANFYNFLNDQIPKDALVLIPTRANGPEPLTRNRYVEFFLWPRAVEYCEGTSEDCIQKVGERNSAVLLADITSLANLAKPTERYQLFNDQWGVYVPDTNREGNLQPPYHSLWEIASSTLLPIILLVALILPGTWLAKRTVPDEHGLMHLALGIGAGLGWLSFSLFIALWLGFQLSGPLIVGLTALYWGTAGSLSVALKTGEKPKRLGKRMAGEDLLIILALCLLVVWAFILAIGNAYSHTDEIVLWGSKGYGIPAVGLQEGATERGTLTTWYPLNVPLLIGSFLTLFGERLPESKLVFPFYLLGFAGLLYTFFRKKTQALPSLIGTLLIATIPTVFLMGTMAHANLPFTFYLVGGILMLYYARTGGQTSSAHHWVWGVIFLILAAWTRPEGLHLAWVVAAAVFVSYGRELIREKRKVYWLLEGLGLYSLFWYAAAPFAYQKPGFTDGVFSLAFSQIMRGNLNLSEAGLLLQSFAVKTLSIDEWGAMGWLLLLFAVLLAWKTRLSGANFHIAAIGLVILVAIFGAFVANSYLTSEKRDIGWWINTSLMRLVFPGSILIWIQFFRDVAGRFFPVPQHEI